MRFTVLGIPVKMDFFFVIGLVMIWSWAGGNRAGLFAAVLVGVFTLIHELGHALTARRFGARSAITLNLLVGWATYAAPRPLTRRQRNLIGLAGPLTQIVVALPLLVVTYLVLPESGSPEALAILRTGTTTVAFDVWQGAVWAGIIIGLLNLLPLWPLDGGHVVDSFLTGALGEHRGRRAMLIGTLVVVGVVAVLGFTASGIEAPYSFVEREVVGARLAPYSALYRSLPSAVWEQIRHFPGHVLDFPLLLIVFCGLNSFLALQRLSRAAPTSPASPGADVREPSSVPRSVVEISAPPAVVQAERTGWLPGTLAPFPSGWAPSPWLQAHLQMRAGHESEARVLVAHATDVGGPRWWLPPPEERPELATLVPLLPPTLEVGDHERALVLLGVLASYGSADQIASFGVLLYNVSHEAETLYLVAGGLARTGNGDDAMMWLRRAVQDQPDHHRLSTDRLLGRLHSRTDFQHLLVEARGGP
ncbi:MAG: hypothetical protein F2873_06065 [Actinobacteria bacterium]|uniref:Unannotated protein n=1 Tax=freshwater metagenome TaxID=449393 RepID=A0A6J7NHY8_9ZZZZ|nr:hypothetical protein [Actinomycetota bacterium]